MEGEKQRINKASRKEAQESTEFLRQNTDILLVQKKIIHQLIVNNMGTEAF